MDKNNTRKRLCFLDNLRAYIIFLVIVLHISSIYGVKVPSWMVDPQGTPFYTLLSRLIEIPTMPVLFFIAGYFTLSSLIKKGAGKFIKDKLIRIGIPLIFGVLILIPGASYILNLSEGSAISYFDFWFFDAFNKTNFTYHQFWFLTILLPLFIIVGIVYTFAKEKISNIKIKTQKPSLLFLGVFFLVTVVLESVICMFNQPVMWTVTYFIQFQTVRLFMFISYFILGIYAYVNNWFDDKNNYKIIIPTLISVISSISTIVVFYLLFEYHIENILQNLIYSFLENLAVLSSLFMFIGIFKKCFNYTSSLMGKVTESSFSTYIIHLNVVFIVCYYFILLNIPLVVKFLLSVIICTLISWVIGYLLKKAPILKEVL